MKNVRKEFLMKSRILMLAFAVAAAVGMANLVACSSNTEATTTTEVQLPTMQCGACENTISTALKGVEGVKEVKVDLKNKKAEVAFFANQVTVAKIEDAVVKSGYAANDKKADAQAYEKLPECCKVGQH
jgi:mercuric ion binding protein